MQYTFPGIGDGHSTNIKAINLFSVKFGWVIIDVF